MERESSIEDSHEWKRAKELWSWRLEVASNANHSSDFKPEMEAFSQLVSAAPDTENMMTLWSLLEGFLPYLGGSEEWKRIWHNLQEYLAREVERDPVEVICFYNLMHDRVSVPGWYYERTGRKIIDVGARNKESQNDVILLIDKINRTGNYQFKDVQERILAERHAF